MSQADEMGGIVLRTLLEEYATEHKIEPSDSEMDAYIAFQREQKRQMQAEERNKSEIIEEMLGKLNALSELQDDEIIFDPMHLEMVNRMLEADPEMVRSQNEAVRQRQEEMLERLERRLDQRMAKASVLAWKVNLAIFNHYGGRVLFQQAGPEPLDAYRDFLREHKKKGSFKILDEEFAPAFWDYFVNEDMHIFISETREEGLDILGTPMWLMKEPSKDQVKSSSE